MKWPKNIAAARAMQEDLKGKNKITPLKEMPHFIAGVDAAFQGNKVVAAACLFEYPRLEPVEDSCHIADTPFPYFPGFLTFREGPAIVKALKKLNNKPDLLLMDGQGIAHPRAMGIAAHLGIVLDIPSVGCAKSRLIGDYVEPGYKKGDWSYLRYNDSIVGVVLRTRSGIKPLFVSPGHKIDLAGSIMLVLDCTENYRIPEPLRRADMLSKKLKKEVQLHHLKIINFNKLANCTI